MREVIKGTLLCCLVASITASACSKGVAKQGEVMPGTITPKAHHRPGSLGVTGDTANVVKTTESGMVLMGGGKDVDAAFKWMINRSGGGDVVVIRATGTDAYDPYIFGLGDVNSVETLKIDSRELADNDTVANIVRNAEMLFIAGGDQGDYMKYWKNTKLNKAINYLLTDKKVPVGGTSAGCAIMGGYYYSGENGGVTSEEALANPYNSLITLYDNDFLHAPYLQNVITDQHFITRSRAGRALVFVGRIMQDWKKVPNAICADERTAVCIDKDGVAKVYGDYSADRAYSYAYFLKTDGTKTPEQLINGGVVTWNRNNMAVQALRITADEKGGGSFNVKSFNINDAAAGKKFYWWAEGGVFKEKEQQ